MAHTSQFAIRAACGHVPALPSLCQHTLLPQKIFQCVRQNLQRRARVDKWHKTLKQWNRVYAGSDTPQRVGHTKYCGCILTLGQYFLIFCVGPGSNTPQRNINIFGDFSRRLSQLQKTLLTTDIQRLTERWHILGDFNFYFLSFSFWGGVF